MENTVPGASRASDPSARAAPSALTGASAGQVRKIASAVARGSRSAVAVATEALERAAAYDAVQPQAWISRVPEAAVLAAARAIDARCASGERLPLAGVPFAVKDNIDVSGMDTTVACPAFAQRPTVSATAVDRLLAAGALLLGKTNLDQFATGLVGTRSPYGAPGCVFRREFISGGSSSGSAVVVGAGVVAFSLGSDTAGSGRVPAAYNGLVGWKPTRGRISTRGVFPACRSLDCVSIFAADAADAALVDEVLAHFDPEDPFSRRAPPPAAPWPADLRVGIAPQGQLQFFGDAQSSALFATALERLAAAGARLVEIDAEPLLSTAQLLYGGPWVAERLAAVGPFLKKNAAAVHPVVRAIVQTGAAVTGVDAFRGLHVLQERMRAAERIWEAVDVLAMPTVATIYRIADVLAEPVALNSNLGYYTNFVNLLDMCAVSLPAGYRGDGTGFGASLIGPAGSDENLLALARRLEVATAPIERPPLDLAAHSAGLRLAVVGAHLSGMPLHWQLAARSARLVARTTTAARYRLLAMADQSPPKPALVHVGDGGSAIEIEIYEMNAADFGTFVAAVPPPLAIGTVELAGGGSVHGFVAEPRAMAGARDISALGGWRAYLAQEGGQ